MTHSSRSVLLVPFVLALGSALHAQTIGGAQSIPNGQPASKPLRPELASDRLLFSAAALTGAAYAPGDPTRLYVMEQRGMIQVLDLTTETVNGTPFLDIDALVIGGGGERGLLGLAFHPDFQNNGLFYVNYSRTLDGDTVVSEFKATTADVADPLSERIVLEVNQPQSNHNGGWLGFSPLDGYLYIAMGDGGNACDTGGGHTASIGNAQDLTSNLLGKMLRIDPTGAVPYAIPPSNPFVGVAGDDEIWAFGLRNPWRCGFDRLTGDLYIGDVGQDLREEVDFQPWSSAGGENYGWRCREGNACSTTNPSGCPSTTGCTCPGSMPSLTAPVHDYSHQAAPGVCSVIGGYPYRGTVFPHIGGHFFFADYCFNAIWSFRIADGVKGDFRIWTSRLSPSIDGFAIANVRSFAEDDAGEIYIITTNSVFKIVPKP